MKRHWDRKKVIADSMIWQQYTTFNHNTLYCPHFLGSPSSVYLQKLDGDSKTFVGMCYPHRNFPIHYNTMALS
ncbi:hypothetical protein ATZ36_06825, partial [Candidatus Endomicrobiellum trichonymphae]